MDDGDAEDGPNVRIETNDAGESMWTATRDAKQGDALRWTYGELSNEEMWLWYGFVPENPLHGDSSVAFNLPDAVFANGLNAVAKEDSEETGALRRRLLERAGVNVELGVDIERITMNAGRATGAASTDGRSYIADRVICNGDPPTVYQQMLPGETRSKRAIPEAATKYSMGLYVLFFGARKQYPDVAHHTIWMGPRYRELLADIFDRKILADDFSLYLHRPTATDSSFAPEGCDSFYVLCPVPNLLGDVDWDVEGPRLRDRIAKALEETIMPGLGEAITDDFWMTPEDFKRDYRSMHGAGFSIAPIFTQSAWFRYHNRDPHIPNLYFSAAGAHPGAGMPGVLCSAKVVERLIEEEDRAATASGRLAQRA